jgi:hypothetical protein
MHTPPNLILGEKFLFHFDQYEMKQGLNIKGNIEGQRKEAGKTY